MYLTKVVRDEVEFRFFHCEGRPGKKSGTTTYFLMGERNAGSREFNLPNTHTLRQLAKKFLRCEHFDFSDLSKKDPRKSSLYLEIDIGIPREDRAAFLAAVAVNSHIVRTA